MTAIRFAALFAVFAPPHSARDRDRSRCHGASWTAFRRPICPWAGSAFRPSLWRALEELAQYRRPTFSFGGQHLDQHGRLLAHLHDESGTLIQGEMLRLGLARVYSFPDNRARIPEMLV